MTINNRVWRKTDIQRLNMTVTKTSMCSVNIYKFPQRYCFRCASPANPDLKHLQGVRKALNKRNGGKMIVHFVAKVFYCVYSKVFVLFVPFHFKFSFQKQNFPFPQMLLGKQQPTYPQQNKQRHNIQFIQKEHICWWNIRNWGAA